MAHPLQQTDFLTHTLTHPDGCEPANWSMHGADFQLLDAGILQIEPSAGAKGAGQKCRRELVVSCGIHGNETAPIEIVNQLVGEILSGELQVKQRLLLLIGNPLAINAGRRDVKENMNRMFGDWLNEAEQTDPERIRAARLQQAVKQFYESGEGRRLHFDLHTAIRGSKREKFAVHPFTDGKPYSREFLQLLNAGEVDTVLLMHEPATTFSYFSHRYLQADAATLELGRVAPFGENDMQKFSSMIGLLRDLIAARTPRQVPFEQLTLFAVTRAIHKQNPDFTLNFADDTYNFTPFKQGEVIATDGGTTYVADIDGEAIIFPNARVPIGQRALLTVAPTILNASRLRD